jgi:DNA replication licensing factor MCM4
VLLPYLDIDQLVSVKGLLIRASPVIPDLKRAFFRCTSCDHTIEVENDRGVISEPTKCEVPSCKKTNSMQLIHNRCVFSDKQVCRLQETPDETPDGQTPYTVSMCVYDDLMDVAKPGDRIEITGIFRGIPVRVNPNRRAIKALFKTYVDIVHIKRTDKNRIGIDKTAVSDNEYQVIFEEGDSHEATTPEEEEAILEMSRRSDLYELLSRSIAPSIFGMEDVKKGILLQLFGGSHKFSKNRAGSPRIRGDLNILLVGDPGVSKSQLLQYVHKLAPRGVYTSGKGSSAVGLTAYITRDPDTRQLVLESGALVLSDGGVCCIDEFDKMSESTRSILHEVMEQQTISVAKAGIITTLNARTSILACANPINSKFDKNLSVPQNVNLPPPLMSRFDLLYLILDKPNEQDDRRLAQHLVSLYISEKPTMSQVEFVPLQTFTRYINQAKKIQPVLSEEAGQALVNYYIAMRKSGNSGGGQNVISFTTRQLESMIRLSEAHAKMRLSSIVEKRDVEEANRLVLSALQTAAVDPRTGKIDLDLVTTGISSWGRKVHEQKRVAVRQVIQQSEKQVMKWVQVFKTFIDQSDLVNPSNVAANRNGV